MKYDIILPEYTVEPVAASAQQIQDWGHVYLNATAAYGKTRGEGAVIFIIDTAGEFTHPDLAANALPEYDRNITNSPAADLHGHGTHCAGIAGAVDNGKGVIGIAPNVGLVALKALNDSGSGSFSWVAEQIRYVADLKNEGRVKGKKRIISLSLGGPAGVSAPAVLKQAIDYAIGKGCFVVAAAGNNGDGTNDTTGAPGNYSPVIAVASTDQPGDKRSSFSSVGRDVDLAAPGGRVYSTHKGGGYARLSGTSMACPQVAGVMALVLSLRPEISHQDELAKFLAANATDILTPGTDRESGYGSPVVDKYLTDGPDTPPPDEPEHPDEPQPPAPDAIPRRFDVVRNLFPVRTGVMPIYWRRDNESGMKLAFIDNITVAVTSNVRTEYMAATVEEYVRGFFAGRAMVLKEGWDLREVALWAGVYMQFIADDDWVVERFGMALNLEVLEIEGKDHDGNVVRVTDSEIKSRAATLQFHREGSQVARLEFV